jgi:hypothetical protein
VDSENGIYEPGQLYSGGAAVKRDYQRGSAILVAIGVFLAVSLLGLAIIDIAGMESQIAINDVRTEQARQAADAGVHLARTVVINYLLAGRETPDIGEVKLDNHISADVTVNMDRLYSEGIVSIVSQGRVKNAHGILLTSKTAKAEIMVNMLPRYPLQADNLTVMGRYFAAISDKPVYLQGTSRDNLRNVQDWHPTAWYTESKQNFPLHGLEYGDAILKNPYHPNYTPENSNSDCPYTWWINYPGTAPDPEVGGSILNIAPYWKPLGVVNIFDRDYQPATMAVRSWFNNISPELNDELFEKPVPQPVPDYYPLKDLLSGQTGYCNYIYPPADFESFDFMGQYSLDSKLRAPRWQVVHSERFKKLAQTDTDWLYISPDSSLLSYRGENYYELAVNDPRITCSRWFIDLPDTATLVLDFTVPDSFTGEWVEWDTYNNLADAVLNDTATFFNRFRNRLESLIVVSPAILEIGLDSRLITAVNDFTYRPPGLYFISQQDINLFIDPRAFNSLTRILPNYDSNQKIYSYILAGRNVRIVSTPERLAVKGVLCAGSNIMIKMEYFDEHYLSSLPNREIEKRFDLIRDDTIVKQFPESWDYLGIGPVVSCQYLD